MKKFECQCGQALYFENTQCIKCKRPVIYDFETDQMWSLDPVGADLYENQHGKRFRLCRNYTDYQVCNVGIPVHEPESWCASCRLNQTIPNLSQLGNVYKWAKLETAKRRLLRTLFDLGLGVAYESSDTRTSLSFELIEDQQQNPNVAREFVATGHYQGLITINLAEADDAMRESAREQLGELYRTPLGHLRHESGHYYFESLIRDTKYIDSYRSIFGDERISYQDSLNQYYQSKPHLDWQAEYISEYSMVHPLEDWAECWAHYLHMYDTLETAYQFGAIVEQTDTSNIDEQLLHWTELSTVLNELNRSMGLKDAYPFVLSSTIIKKLKFVHQVIDPKSGPRPPGAVG